MKLSVGVSVCLLLAAGVAVGVETGSGLKILTPEETSSKLAETQSNYQQAQFVGDLKDLPLSDSSANYGDLIYRYRENGDVLLLREVVVLNEISSNEMDVQWYATFNARRVTSVRVLNFGRERAYCLRIDVGATDVQTILRILPVQDPRILVEIYGF